jgi:hypothetical protein
MKELINSRYIKALIIDYLIKNLNSNFVIGSEIMFGSRRGMADLVLLSEGLTFSYEIKAQNDDFRKIKVQLEEYNKVFDHVYLVTTEKHLLKAQNAVSDNNGLMIISNDCSVQLIRNSKQNTILNKEELLSTMTIRFIEHRFKLPHKRVLAKELRNTLETFQQNEIQKYVYEFLYQRIKPRFDNFIMEKGIATHFEEIALLSMPNKRLLF